MGGEMDGKSGVSEEVPLGQRLYDNWVLLLIAGVLVVSITYVGWGLYEILTLPQATLP
jgi:hypothetical protein